MNNFEKKIFNLVECPTCAHDYFYMSDVHVGIFDEWSLSLSIRPSKFKLTIKDAPRIDLPIYWATCEKCGNIFSYVDHLSTKKHIENWAKNNTLDNTIESICRGCNNSPALEWIRKLKSDDLYMQFRTKLFSGSICGIGKGPRIKLQYKCTLCLSCGLVNLQAPVNELKKKGKSKYLKKWPLGI